MQRKETFTKVPRLIVLAFTVMLMGFVAAGCEGVPATLSPAVSPTSATQIAQAPSPTATVSPTATPTPKPTTIPSSTPTPTKTPTPRPTATPTKEPTPTPKPVEMVATGNVDVYLSPDGQKVGYFVPGQRFTPTGKEQNGWIQVVTNGNTLWIQEGGPYGPAGEVKVPSKSLLCPESPARLPPPERADIQFRPREFWAPELSGTWLVYGMIKDAKTDSEGNIEVEAYIKLGNGREGNIIGKLDPNAPIGLYEYIPFQPTTRESRISISQACVNDRVIFYAPSLEDLDPFSGKDTRLFIGLMVHRRLM